MFPGFNNKKHSTISSGDFDRDGVSNRKDCQPMNWKKQGPVHDKIAMEFYGRKYKDLSDEEKFDVDSGVQDGKTLKKRIREGW